MRRLGQSLCLILGLRRQLPTPSPLSSICGSRREEADPSLNSVTSSDEDGSMSGWRSSPIPSWGCRTRKSLKHSSLPVVQVWGWGGDIEKREPLVLRLWGHSLSPCTLVLQDNERTGRGGWGGFSPNL